MALSSSEVAPAALCHLQSLEKHLKDEDSAFFQEIVQCLRETVAAITKLEEIRRHTLECLEEETIKTSNLRFRIQRFPGEIIAEMRALVAAARESNAAEISQLHSAVKSIAGEIELLEEKQSLCESQNAALCEEQKHLWKQCKEREDLLNEKMAMKANTTVLLNETHDKIRDKEEELIRAKAALAELKEKIAAKINKVEKEKEEDDEKVAELKGLLDTQEEENSKKKHELENLNAKLLEIQHLISLHSTAILNEKALLAKLKEKSKQLEKNLEFEVAEMLALSEKKIQLDSELLLLQSIIAQETEHFNKELEKTEEDLHNAKCQNENLKSANKALHQKYEQALEEQQHWALKRDEMVQELGKLSALLDEKLEFLGNRMMEKENLEKDTKYLEDILLNMKKRYAEELASLKQDLETQKKTKVQLQWKLLCLAMQRKLFCEEEENQTRKATERKKAGEKRHAELLLETEKLEKEIFQCEKQVKTLSEEASKRENNYKHYKEDLMNKMKCLEKDIKTANENLLKNEQELNTSRLTLEETQRETELKQTKYKELKKSFLKKKDEEAQVKRAIQKSIKITGKLKEDTLKLRMKLRTKRDAAVDQLKNHTDSVKLLEQDICEINRKYHIVNTQNCRFKLHNAQIKEDIFAVNLEAENHKAATVKILNDLAVLHDLLLKGWSEESFIQKEILENKQETLDTVAALTTKIQQREEKIGDINSRLQNKLEGLDSLVVQKNKMDDLCFAEG